MTFGIFGNTLKDNLWSPVYQVLKWLETHKKSIILQADIAKGLLQRGLIDAETAELYTKKKLYQVDVLLSFGGDGTLLRAAHKVAKHETPILGINIGRLGFLAEIEVRVLDQALEKLQTGLFKTQPRMMLEAQIQCGEVTKTRLALNEFVFSKSAFSNILAIETHIDGQLLAVFRADGLIISTPTGSTAYSLSSGGPIVMPQAEALVVTPISPHTLTQRPIILGADIVMTAKVKEPEKSFIFSTDGKTETFDASASKVQIQKSPYKTQLIVFDDHDYFATLRNKLGWGSTLV
jgi:NAD+ kinase